MQPAPIRIILNADGEEYICKYLPAGWRDNSASWIFDYKTFGYNLKYSTEKLRFIKEDADFIRRQIDLYGISAEIDFTVQHRQENWTYADSFTGQVDLPAGYINDRDFVEVAVIEGGLKRAYAQNQKTNYEFPLSGTDAVDIEVPEGMGVFENARFDIVNRSSLDVDTSQSKARIGIGCVLNKESSKILTQGLIFNGENAMIETLPSSIKENTTIAADLDFEIKLNINGINFNRPILFFIGKKDSTGNIVNHYNIYNAPAGYFNTHDELKTSGTFEIELNTQTAYKYDLYVEYFFINQSVRIGVSGYISISYFGSAYTDAFSFKALKAETLADKLIKKIHAPASCQIPFLQEMGQNMQLFLTSGDGIRGIPEAQIKTNFQEFQNNLACLFDIGTQVSNKANAGNGTYKIVEKPVIFNPNNLLLDLGKVKEMQLKSVPDEWLANNIKVGYEKQEYDYPLGRQDFACTLEYINDLKIPNKKMELVSKYRADFTGVHLLHYDYVNSDKKDSKSDNDIFWVLAFWKDGKWQAIKGDAVTIGANTLEGGGYFNILLSPHRNLRRHKNYLKSILDRHGKELTYTSSTETQTDIQSTYGGETITEKTNENVSSGTVLFKPIVFEFDALIRRNLSEVMGEAPEGYVKFNFNGVECKGFPIEIAGSYTDSSQKVTCLAHPDTPDNINEIMFKRLPNKLY